jgi:hypothetical protein
MQLLKTALNLIIIFQLTLLLAARPSKAHAQPTTPAATIKSVEELKIQEEKLLAEEEALIKKAAQTKPKETPTAANTATPIATATPTTIPTLIPALATSTPTATPSPTKIIAAATATPAPTATKAVVIIKEKDGKDGAEKNLLMQELQQSKDRIAALTAELDETRSRLMVAETQVERLSSVLENKASRDINVYTGKQTFPAQQPVQKERGPATSPANEAPVAPRILSDSDTPLATVIVEKATLRTGPGKLSTPLMSVSYGTRLAVETREGEWFRVISPTGARAWIEGGAIAFGGKNTARSLERPSTRKELSDSEAIEAEDKALQQLKNRQ